MDLRESRVGCSDPEQGGVCAIGTGAHTQRTHTRTHWHLRSLHMHSALVPAHACVARAAHMSMHADTRVPHPACVHT